MSSDEYYTDESSGFSMGEEIHRRANREQYGSSGPGSRDVGTQMKTHYILEPQRYFSKVRDVGTQTIENANHVIRNPRILSNSYSEAIRVKKEEKEFSFVYDRRKDELYRIRIVSGSEGNSEEDDSSTASTQSNNSSSVHSSGFSHSIDEIHDELRNKRTVGVQMSTKYLVQESRPKVVLRDVAIQTKLANVYGHSQSTMIEQLWRSKTPLSKNVICTLPNSWRQKSDISTSDIGYTSDRHHRTKRKSVPSHRKLETSHRQPGSAWYFENSYDFDRGTSTFVKEGMQQNANSSMLNSGVTKHGTGKHVVSKTEESAYSMSKQCRKWKPKRGSSKGHRRHSSGKSSISTASSVSSRSGHGRPERKSGKKEENFELTSFEYLGDHSSVRLKSEISSISTQTDTERKGPKVFRDPSRKLVSEQQLGDWTVVAEAPKNQRSDNESGIELTYSPPQLTQEKVSLYTRDHSPTPVEPVASCRYPYRPTVNPVYKDEVKMQETDNSLERSSQKSSQNSDRNKDYRSCSVEIGPEPNVLPAEFIEKPVIKTRVRKRKPPPPPNVAIRVGGGWMKEEHHRIQHRPLHRNFMATSDRIPFVRSQFHHNPLKIPVVNKERKHTDKMRYASFIP